MRAPVLTSLMTGAAAALGSLGTKPDSSWYRSLDKPDWQPPGVAFPLVWTPLYGLIAWGTGRAASVPEGRGAMLGLTGADLAVNAGWCWAFFDRESPRAGLAARRDLVAAAALAPYVVWTGFATALNAAIWRRNR